MATEPIWNTIQAALVAALGAIRKSNNSAYWYDVKAVYESDQEQWDKSKLPALVILQVPTQSTRKNAGGSNTVMGTLTYVIKAAIKRDPASETAPARLCYRLVADIHRALTAEQGLGISGVKRVTFPSEPALDDAALAGKDAVIGFVYPLSVEYSFNEKTP